MKKSMVILCVVVLLAGFYTLASADLPDGFVAYYPFNGSAIDETGNGYDATVHGATFSIDRFGNPNSACRIAGNEGPSGPNWIELPDMIEGFESLTISLWVNEDHMGYEHGDGYIWFGREDGDEGDFKAVYIAHWPWPTDIISFRVSTSIEVIEISIPFLTSWQNQWQHYVLVYDGTSGILSAYRNGNLLGENSTDTPSGITTTDSYAGLSTHWGGGGGKYHRFNGMFDEVLIYNRALSPSEVQEIYNDPNPILAPPIADAGADQVVRDTVILDGSASSDTDGSVVSHEWTLLHRENSAYNRTASGITPTVSALNPGFYDVLLTVTDNDGATGSDTMLLAVAGQCDGWPNPNGDLSLNIFNITQIKKNKAATTLMSGKVTFPSLNLAKTIQGRVTIELFDALLGGGDCVLSDELSLKVWDGNKFLVIGK